jgi:hypothetical protein
MIPPVPWPQAYRKKQATLPSNAGQSCSDIKTSRSPARRVSIGELLGRSLLARLRFKRAATPNAWVHLSLWVKPSASSPARAWRTQWRRRQEERG